MSPDGVIASAAAYEAQGVAEIVYAPIGPDVPGELPRCARPSRIERV